jgi:hypothetical protein
MASGYEPEVSDWVGLLMDKREALAKALMNVAYGEGKWNEAVHDGDQDLLSNYRKDAWEILMASPQLLGLEIEENLRALELLTFKREGEEDAD